MEIAPWVEIVAFITGGGGLGVVGTYLGIRKKTQSDLEIAYMTQLNKMTDRIQKLEDAQDDHWDQLRGAVAEEREACDKRIADLEDTFDKRMSNMKAELTGFSEAEDEPAQVG